MARGRPRKEQQGDQPKTKNEGQGILLLECQALPDLDRITKAIELIQDKCNVRKRGHPLDLHKISALVMFNLDRLSAGLPTVRTYISIKTYSEGRLMEILEPPKYREPDAPVPVIELKRPMTTQKVQRMEWEFRQAHKQFAKRDVHRRHLEKAAEIAAIITSW